MGNLRILAYTMVILMLLPLAFLFLLPDAALAEENTWKVEHGAALAQPSESNSNIYRLEVSCGEPYRLALYTEQGPVLPAGGRGEADYFYKPGRIEAEVAGGSFPLVAAGSDDAVVLFREGTAEQGYMADLDPDLLAAITRGTELTLSFDITPGANAKTDSPFETFARFSLKGAGEAIAEALAGCEPS